MSNKGADIGNKLLNEPLFEKVSSKAFGGAIKALLQSSKAFGGAIKALLQDASFKGENIRTVVEVMEIANHLALGSFVVCPIETAEEGYGHHADLDDDEPTH